MRWCKRELSGCFEGGAPPNQGWAISTFCQVQTIQYFFEGYQQFEESFPNFLCKREFRAGLSPSLLPAATPPVKYNLKYHLRISNVKIEIGVGTLAVHRAASTTILLQAILPNPTPQSLISHQILNSTPENKTSSQAPSYARRLQSETTTHSLTYSQG